ncbi:hypothetical protein M3I53_31315 [Paraburkholderia sp. CNPSo 3272]|uniref:hypothetical protein n=1 Tax=Paraburkholderia sp. CNPSo 3272 TaxID=2940931 RepID=UPI0020B7C168|nr:hypothetical protein [Paraburkholderia sp. CNPSo 3272]MCP3727557.1 hypothetical protein [Paraburkholderia sp. CNPSo 3272]
MKKRILMILLVSALVLVGVLLTVEQGCTLGLTEATRATADAFSGNGSPNGETSHCLVYGKYCLSNVLRSQ